MTAEHSLSPINESSTTASLIDPETTPYDDFELDELFSELKKAHNPTTSASLNADDELSKIRASIHKLPKIAENGDSLTGIPQKLKNTPLYLKSAKNDSTKKSGIVNIQDPVTAVKKNSKEEPTSAGDKWFDMPKAELTDSVKRDLKIIEQRAALDPKRHYKKDKWKAPEFFQIGTIVEGNTEFYSVRLKNKDRHTTILESVMHDDDTQKYFKRKYDQIQAKKTSGKKAHYKKVKEARKRF